VKNILSDPTTFGVVSTSATLANTPVTSATPVSTANESPQSSKKAREAVFDTANPIDRRCPTRVHHSVFCFSPQMISNGDGVAGALGDMMDSNLGPDREDHFVSPPAGQSDFRTARGRLTPKAFAS
jgi:hypothetical protein